MRGKCLKKKGDRFWKIICTWQLYLGVTLHDGRAEDVMWNCAGRRWKMFGKGPFRMWKFTTITCRSSFKTKVFFFGNEDASITFGKSWSVKSVMSIFKIEWNYKDIQKIITSKWFTGQCPPKVIESFKKPRLNSRMDWWQCTSLTCKNLHRLFDH